MGSVKKINDRNGFSLLQFFVFIVILGLIMFIAVPLVRNYLANSRKKNFIITAENYVEQVKKDIIVAGGTEMEKGEKLVFSLEDLGVSETRTKSAYGNTWDFSKSYIIVENIGTDLSQRYEHYVALTDSKGYCIPVSNVKNLDEKLVKEKDCNVSEINQFDIKKVDLEYHEEIWKYRDTITKIVFEDRILDVEDAIEKFDLSSGNNGMVMGYIVPNDNNKKTYTAYIQSEKRILANKDSSYLFANFKNLTTIEGLKYFDTSNVKNMEGLFKNCKSIENLDLSSLDTTAVTKIDSMFSNMSSLSSLDIRNMTFDNLKSDSHVFDGVSDGIQVIVLDETQKEIVETSLGEGKGRVLTKEELDSDVQ